MLTLYIARDERLQAVEIGAAPPDSVLWIDLLNPSEDEESRVEALLGIDVPTRDEMAEIEVSSRLYRENDAIYMTASLLTASDEIIPSATPVTFILTKGRLVTVRYSQPGVFGAFVKQTQRGEFAVRDADGVFAGLLEAIIDRTADTLERVGADVDKLSREVFDAKASTDAISRDYRIVISRIGQSGDLNAKVRESLVSVGRLVNFLAAECATLHPALHERTETMLADIRSLTDHASYVTGTITFILDATLGLISFQQNAVIKILSVVSVVIMPPMLIATIYGMNFDVMPELRWRYSYPVVLVAMLVSAIIPYWYFRKRGWM